MKLNIVPVILCGGSGARLWPESRENHPKQFIKLMGNLSLLQNTALRAQRVVGDVANSNLAGPVTVTTSSLADKVALHLSSVSLTESRQHILREPCARNTAAAIAYAALYVREVFGDQSLMWILPSDHYVGNESALTQAVSKAVAVAKKGYLVTFGIHPHRAETGYGYIRTGKEIYNGAHIAKSFVEKPDKKTAQNFIDTGEYLWNSGMFLFRQKRFWTPMKHMHRRQSKKSMNPSRTQETSATSRHIFTRKFPNSRLTRPSWRIPAGMLPSFPAIPSGPT